MRPSALLRLALAGTRTDTVRVLLTAFSAALAALAAFAALTVLAIPTPPASADNMVRWSEQYSSALLREPGLRGGTAFALVLLMVPVLALAGQCARLGAPARDRRLAALRLAGATPGQVTRLAMLETGVAGLLGTLSGLALYLVGRELLHRPDERGQLALPTDVLPHAGALAAVVVGLPLVAGLATALMLRLVITTPLGVTRRAARERGPGPWAGVLIVVGVAAFILGWPVLLRRTVDGPFVGIALVLIAAGGLAAILGTVTGTGWISHTTGRLLRRYARHPAPLLAAGRLMSDPWAGSRAFAALLAAVTFGAGAAGLRSHFVTEDRLARQQNRLAGVEAGANPFYLNTISLVDLAVTVAVLIAAAGLLVAVVEGLVARRRAYAALTATGVPRTTLAWSLVWQAVLPAVPAILLALTVGAVLARALFGDAARGPSTTSVCDAGAQLCADPVTREQYTRITESPAVHAVPDIPLEQLALLGGGALAAVLATVGIGLLFLRPSTAIEELRAT
ncbi:FtsX-like permease family protein [Micromonospora sp. WP24]|uniref:ABC transporter permease n=1 Tax=Micromonospora sp. WP24 TaxID=2604469 RepID=UPI0011D34964|nr:FtsX-like permease family protein [Micromonospora sp. WP24]TYC06530.1 FtsX-like permease family protein [Micromonospora sp. WP24]